MVQQIRLSDAERAQVRRKIENSFAFAREVLETPSLLDAIPNESEVEAIPIEEREEGRNYDIETPHMVVTVTPPERRKIPTG